MAISFGARIAQMPLDADVDPEDFRKWLDVDKVRDINGSNG